MSDAFLRRLAPDTCLKQFHSTLLGPTLENALKTEYYQEKLQINELKKKPAEFFESLPYTHKSDIQAAGESAQVRDNIICEEYFTGGTTNTPFTFVVSRREKEYCEEFFSSLYLNKAWKHVRAIEFSDPTVPDNRSFPFPVRKHKLSIYKVGSFDHARKILNSKHTEVDVEEDCTVLIATERILRAFTLDTSFFVGKNTNFSLRTIISYGQYIPREWRNFYQDFWRCQLIDVYGLSEVVGGAICDGKSPWYYFDPIVIPEVVGHRSLDIIKEGIGVLLLTPLYPFQEAQPLIRYYTGDLVEVTHCGPTPNRLAIRPLGRAKYGVPAPDGDDWLITPNEIYEVMDALPSIERLPLFLDAKQIKIRKDLGHPIYSTKYFYREECVFVEVYVCLLKTLSPLEIDSALLSIKLSLLTTNIKIKNAVDDKYIHLQITNADNIEADIISYPN